MFREEDVKKMIRLSSFIFKRLSGTYFELFMRSVDQDYSDYLVENAVNLESYTAPYQFL
jgi:hypothetical protein